MELPDNSTSDETDSNNWTKSQVCNPVGNHSASSKLNLFPPAYSIRQTGTKGRCLLLNYEKFSIFAKSRKGSKYDVKAVRRTFSQFGFQISEHHNLTVEKTIELLQYECKLDHSSFDCFVLIILSHGEREHIYCADDLLPLETIFDYLTPGKCHTLKGKPKLCFIQACRGEDCDNGVTTTLVHDSPVDLGIGHFLLPNVPDFLVFYSTYPGYVSWRNKDTGSWFIQDLCEALCKYAPTLDLLTLCTLTTRMIAFNRVSKGDLKNKKQIPCMMSSLTKRIYLK